MRSAKKSLSSQRLLLLSAISATTPDGCPTSCDVSLYMNTGFGTKPCEQPGVDFGCYSGTDLMWIRPPCGALFRCNVDDQDSGPDPARQRGFPLRCGSRWFRPAPGQTRLNCTCGDAKGRPKHHHEKQQNEQPLSRHKKTCGEERAHIDKNGGVSSAYRRLPMPPGANPAVRCCSNGHAGGNRSVTLNSTQRDYAAWPAACAALCDREPGCRFFSHSVRASYCVVCAACEPQILLGDDTFASFERVTEDPTVLYEGVLR